MSFRKVFHFPIFFGWNLQIRLVCMEYTECKTYIIKMFGVAFLVIVSLVPFLLSCNTEGSKKISA